MSTSPAESAPKKKRFYTRWWFIAIVVIVVILIVANASGGDDTSTESSTSATQSGETTESEESAGAEVSYKVGDDVVVGDVTFKVTSVEVADYVGENEYSREEASGKFVVVDLTITNNGSEAIDMDSSYFKLLKDDVEYETDSDAITALLTDERAIYYETINPGNSFSGAVAFDIPADVADPTQLTLQVQTGAFGTETGLISLAS